jgi:hypothetical protein
MFSVDYSYEDSKFAGDFIDNAPISHRARQDLPRQCMADPAHL